MRAKTRRFVTCCFTIFMSAVVWILAAPYTVSAENNAILCWMEKFDYQKWNFMVLPMLFLYLLLFMRKD